MGQRPNPFPGSWRRPVPQTAGADNDDGRDETMNIEKVTSEDLRRMENQEGLILQGCGGDLNEWVDGINQMLTANGCLREGTQFQKVSTFDQEGLTCLLFHFTDDVKVNGARLAMLISKSSICSSLTLVMFT